MGGCPETHPPTFNPSLFPLFPCFRKVVLMVYEVPKANASIGQDKFDFKIPGSKSAYTIPLMKHLKPSVAAKVIELGDLLGMRFVLDKYAPGSFDEFEDTDQLNGFIGAWRTASGIGLGESSASSNS